MVFSDYMKIILNHPNLLCSFCHTLTLLGLCVWLDIIVALLMIRLSRIFYPTTRKNSTATLLGPKNRILCSSVSLVMDSFNGGSKKSKIFCKNELSQRNSLYFVKTLNDSSSKVRHGLKNKVF